MTVAELIEALQGMPSDNEVRVGSYPRAWPMVAKVKGVGARNDGGVWVGTENWHQPNNGAPNLTYVLVDH